MTAKEIYDRALGGNLVIDWKPMLSHNRLSTRLVREYCYKECRDSADASDSDCKCRRASSMLFNYMMNRWMQSQYPI
jgi:hypothetical protein